MTNKAQYDWAHFRAKIVVCAIIVVLSLFHNHIPLDWLLIIINVLFFFGVNTVAYILETVKHWNHKHNKI